MKAKTFLILFVAALSFKAFASEDADRESDCSILRGLSVAYSPLTVKIGDYGNASYWAEMFDLRRNLANSVVSQMNEKVIPFVKTEIVKVQLRALSSGIANVRQNGSGDVNYWTDLVVDQSRSYSRYWEELRDLRDKVCANE